MALYLTLTLVFPALALCAPTGRQMIDMTHALVDNGKMPHFPGITPYNFTIDVRGNYKDTGIYVELNTIKLSEHTATHVDAPAHFGGKNRIHQIPNEDLIGQGAVIDIRQKAENDSDAEVLVEDLVKYEEKYGRIPDRSFVFCFSGWDKYWMNKKKFLGNDQDNAKELHSPGFSLEATKWLAENRNIIGIGADAISIEKGFTTTFPVHRYLLGKKDLLGFEMVANLEKVPPSGATIYAFPMKIYDGSGAPVRMFAILNGGSGIAGSAIVTSLSSMLALYFVGH